MMISYSQAVPVRGSPITSTFIGVLRVAPLGSTHSFGFGVYERLKNVCGILMMDENPLEQ